MTDERVSRSETKIHGDQINQSGDGNIGVQYNAARSSVELSAQDRANALLELDALVREFDSLGVLRDLAQNQNVIVDYVKSHESKLARLLKAVSLGAGQAVAKALDHAAGPVLVAMIENHVLS